MRAAAKAVAGCALASLATPAAAHGNADLLGPFYGALLHAVIVPPEALAAIATGLALGTCGRSVAQRSALVFITTLACGLLVGAVAYSDRHMEWLLVAVALVGGALVAAEVKLPLFGAVSLAAVAGVAVGIDASPAVPSFGTAILTGAATLMGGSLVVMMVIGLTLDRDKSWQRIAVRVAGSWIVAIAVLYLAWTFKSVA
ncbi:MAG: HupE/UreJ family protein [Rhizobiaceae bacterium]|nr:HupE/UreJ family protein [Rhizobiaceae bacterium]